MADFVAVLKKTIDAQADKSPELRQRVYAKARATIEQKLVTANASQAVAVRQRDLLEDAIEQVEAFYAPLAPVVEEPPEDALEDFLRDTSAHADDRSWQDVNERARLSDESNHERYDPALDEEDDSSIGSERGDDSKFDRAKEKAEARRSEYIERATTKEKGSYKGLIAGVVALLVLAGIGFGIWANKEKLQEMASSLGRSDAPSTSGDTPANTDKDNSATQPAENAENNAPGDDTQTPAPQPDDEQKLTQRLMPDGSEVDDGPAGEAQSLGEGKSTAASTSAGSAAPAAPGNQSADQQPVAQGQQALLYEERGGTEQGSVERGTVEWSVIQESPGDGQPDEPAVRGSITLPTSKLQLKMTVRKNTDQSIPASHLIEMVFIPPEDFSGGVIDNVQRITFKDTEQATGNPLIAVPSKIADNFFIIWLNDARTAQDTNLSLMRRLQWIDIPVSYRNGRRALISLEKGAPGEKAFTDVLGAN
ncbi:transcriptional regulator [Brucella sp. BE17]|uniref:transcriptional regulator n=1 Tax=Brucella sp. BE17 TaxID=3142977 RepID=UPI0031B9BF38